MKLFNTKNINITLRLKQLRNKTNGEDTGIGHMKNIGLNRTEQAKEYHQKKFEELGIEKQPEGRPRRYETKEEANQTNLANIKRIYHEKKTTTNKVGRPSLPLEDKINK